MLDILIIYQDEALVRVLPPFLAAEGYRINCIPCEINAAVQALLLLPDLIIMEIALSELTAVEIISHLNAQTGQAARRIPVIVVSDFPPLEFELQHISDFIGKPVDLTRLAGSIACIAAGGKSRVSPARHVRFSPQENLSFSELVCAGSGLRFDRHNISILERGVGKRMAALRIGSCKEYYDYLTASMKSRQELQKLIQFITVGESFFFRQQGHYALLINSLLPGLAGSPSGRRIRLFSAGCSTGEEAYSMAMAVMEAVPDWENRDIRIIGADINKLALMRAVDGEYSRWKVRETERRYLDKYFNRRGERYVVKDELKSMVDFVHLDLRSLRSPANSGVKEGFDVIFCRNVMIYFSVETIKQVAEGFNAALKPEGRLFIGHAESLGKYGVNFERLFENGVYSYRKRRGGGESEKNKAELPAAASLCDNRQPALAVAANQKESLDIDALYDDAMAHKHKKSYALAGDLFRQIIVRRPDHTMAIVGEAMILAYGGSFNQALERCNRALQLDDLLPEVYYIRGYAFDRSGRKKEALDEYRKAILLKMDFVMPHYRLGKLYVSTGQTPQGKRALKNCLKILAPLGDTAIIPFSRGLTKELLLEQLQRELHEI